MASTSLSIYFAANLAASAWTFIFHMRCFEELDLIVIAAMFSFVFSLPVIPFLWLIFLVIKRTKLKALEAWSAFVFMISIAAFIPPIVFNFFSEGDVFSFILPISMAGTYTAILVLSISIHHLFKSFNHETDGKAKID